MWKPLRRWYPRRAACQTPPRRRLLLECEELEARTLLSAAHGGGEGLASLDTSDQEALMRIVNGTATSGFPSVGLVGDRFGSFCTGTLIAPRYVLTAGHCAEGLSASAGRFIVGGLTYSTSRIFIHPNYNPSRLGENSANDIAIFELSTAVTGITPSPINRVTPQVGQILTLVGFGAGGDGSGHNGDFGTKRVGTTPIDGVSTTLITWRFDNNQESNTAPGDSGGPAFLVRDGVYYVAGVTSGGTSANAGIGDFSFDTRVDAYAAWIDGIASTTPTPTPDPTPTPEPTPTPTPTPSDDHGNDFASATPIQVSRYGSSFRGRIETGADVDFFRFVAPASGRLVIRTFATSWTLDTMLGGYNAGGRLLKFNDDASYYTLDSRIRLDVRKGRTYYVAVSSYGRSTGDYDLVFNKTTAYRRQAKPAKAAGDAVRHLALERLDNWWASSPSASRLHPVAFRAVQPTSGPVQAVAPEADRIIRAPVDQLFSDPMLDLDDSPLEQLGA